MIKAIIFDMDGVLIDAREWHYDALNKALEHFGFSINRYQHTTTYDGLPTKEKLKMLSKESDFPVGLHTFVNILKQQYTTEYVYQKCNPTFQHEYALSQLKKEGYKLAVCSNSIRSTVQNMMEKSALINYLDFFLSNEDVAKAKPDPEIYTTAIQRLGLTPQECLIVEDNEHGIKAAEQSGSHVMKVSDPTDVHLDAIQNKIKECLT